MRSVSSAIWTLVLPVSCSPAPNCAAISRLRSVVIAAIAGHGSRRRRADGADGASSAASRRGDLARALHVAVHLLDQRAAASSKRRSPRRRARKSQAQLAAVEVAVEVEDVGLDQLAAAGLEGRAHADADGRRASTRRAEARVDAVPGAHERLVGDEVGGREAELAPALVAVHDLAAQLEAARPAGGWPRPPRRRAPGRGCGWRRRSRRRPRAAGARRCRKRASAAQQPRVALRLVAEAEVLADRDRRGAERADEHVVDELARPSARRSRRRTGSRSAPRTPSEATARPCARASSAAAACAAARPPTPGADRTSARCRSRRSPRGGRGARRRRCPTATLRSAAALDVGQASDLHGRKAYCASAACSSRGSGALERLRRARSAADRARRSPRGGGATASRTSNGPDRGAPAAPGSRRRRGRRSASARRCPEPHSIAKAGARQLAGVAPRPSRIAPELLEAVHGDDPLGHLEALAAARALVGALAADLHRRVAAAGAGAARRSAAAADRAAGGRCA